MKFFYFSLAFLLAKNTLAQFAPPAGQVGTTAMHQDSSAFEAWATSANITRGYQDISNVSLGYTSIGNTTSALAKADGDVVSLGDGGYAIVQFTRPIIDSVGADFAVFENSFSSTFLELAFVEVSSDGSNFFRIPATSNSDTVTQIGSFGATDATKLHNLAGKYQGQYGTPFDLADIPNSGLLDKKNITHVKIIDVVGCIQNQYCSRDKNNVKVNDPWPTDFSSGGFDLDAVGVINQKNAVGVRELELADVKLFPNPVSNYLFIHLNQTMSSYAVDITTVLGAVVHQSVVSNQQTPINLEHLSNGIYFAKIHQANKTHTIKFIKS